MVGPLWSMALRHNAVVGRGASQMRILFSPAPRMRRSCVGAINNKQQVGAIGDARLSCAPPVFFLAVPILVAP